MHTIDPAAEETAPTVSTEYPLTLWQRLQGMLRRPQPMLCDVRAEALYRAQIELLDAEACRDQARYELECADSRIRALTDRVRRLSGDTLPHGRSFDDMLKRALS